MPKSIFKRSKYLWFSPRLWMRRLFFWSGALAVGVAAILFAVGANQAIEIFRRIVAYSPYLPLVVCPGVMAGCAAATRRFFPGAQGSGIPQAMAALKMAAACSRDRVLSLKIAAGKILITLIALSGGASVGREGPTVQIGASIMHGLGKLARFPRRDLERGLILAGGAAGVAAAFNTPLAGVVFAIEEMSRSFEERTSGTVMTAVIVAGIVSLAVLGNYTYFGRTSAALNFSDGWIPVLMCAMAGGLLGGLFSRLLIAAGQGLPGKVGAWTRAYPIRAAAIWGLALAVIGIISGNTVYGTGYDEAKRILEGTGNLPAAYGALKLLATLVSYLSGIPGGIFAPSLAAGAGFGQNLAHLMPYAPEGAVVLLGMVAYFAGVVQAPITAFVIVLEMTADTAMVVPLMATALLATAASRAVCPQPLYKALARGFLAGDDRHRNSVSTPV